MRFYKQACEVAERQMGSDHPLTHALLNHAGEAYRNLREKQDKKAAAAAAREHAKQERIKSSRVGGSHGGSVRAVSGQR
jgi:hypothetical protein